MELEGKEGGINGNVLRNFAKFENYQMYGSSEIFLGFSGIIPEFRCHSSRSFKSQKNLDNTATRNLQFYLKYH